MNKVILALFITLAVASAQDMCSFTIMSTLPALQPLYTNFKEKNWVKLEQLIENFVPTAQIISQTCLSKTILTSSSSKACMSDVFDLAQLVAPLAMQLNSSDALVNFVNKFGSIAKNAYMTCYLDLAFGNFEDAEYLDIDELALTVNDNSLEGLKADIFGCINDVASVVPIFTQFIKDVKEKRGFEVIVGDLKQILGNVNRICDDCGIPKPHGKSGPVDIQACLLDAEKLAEDAYAIVNAVKTKNIGGIFSGLQTFFGDFPKALTDCGLVA